MTRRTHNKSFTVRLLHGRESGGGFPHVKGNENLNFVFGFFGFGNCRIDISLCQTGVGRSSRRNDRLDTC